MAAGGGAVLTSFLVNLLVAAGCFLAFSLLRAQPWSKRFFAPRRYAPDLPLHPRRLPAAPWAWLGPVLAYPEEALIDECGLDCAIYLRVLRFGILLFLGLSFWCLVTVLPANLTSGEIDRLIRSGQAAASTARVNGNEYRFTDFDRFSLSNVAPGSPKLWVHLVSLYVVTGYTLWLLGRFNRESVLLRLMFLGNAKRGGPSHTVLVSDIPAIADVVPNGNGGAKQQGPEGGPAPEVALELGPLPFPRPPEAAPSSTGAEGAAGGGPGAAASLPLSGTPPPASAPSSAPSTAATAGRWGSFAAAPAGPGVHATTRPTPAAATAPGPPAEGLYPGSLPLPTPFAAAAAQLQPLPSSASAAATAPDAGVKGGARRADGGGAGDKGDGGGGGASLLSRVSGWIWGRRGRGQGGGGRGGRGGAGGDVGSGRADQQRGSSGRGRDVSSGGSGGGGGSDGGGEEEAVRIGLALPPPPAAGDLPPRQGDQEGGDGGEEGEGEEESEEEGEWPLVLLPEWGVDTAPREGSLRGGKRFAYDVADPSLDPGWQARSRLGEGLSPEQLVEAEFTAVYGPGAVAAVNLVPDTRDLEPLLLETLRDRLDLLSHRLRLHAPPPAPLLRVQGWRYGAWGRREVGGGLLGRRVDAVEFWIKRLRHLRDRIREAQADPRRRCAPAAFVTFTTRTAQAVGSAALHAHTERSWLVGPAPAPFELVWPNLGLTGAERGARRWSLWILFWLMALFFMIPVTAIQALIEVPKLARLPVLGPIVRAPAVRQILEAVVPGLALKLFLTVVPMLLRAMALHSGARAESAVDFGVVRRYFLFQVIVVFGGNVIAGSFFNQLQRWVSAPGSVPSTLGRAIPMTSTFFINYLITNGLGAKSIAFLRLPAFAVFWVLSRFAGSPRAKQRLWMFQYTDYGTTTVDHTITVLLGLTFSLINPIVCPAALAYFLVTSVGERYNNIYVFRRRYESAGKLWKTVYNQVMTSLYVMQITLIGLLGLKRFPWVVLAVPCPLTTLACHLSTLALYRRPWTVTALHDAAELDAAEAAERRGALREEARKARKASRRRGPGVGGGGPVELGLPLLAEEVEAEARLRSALASDAGALEPSPAERQALAQTYRNPCFKVPLDPLEDLEALAAQLRATAEERRRQGRV
ncbi:hypothetical protein HYH03_018986 [Edaphochlamys debaryana]|uniref:Uncharacterized protein n=1 Tax=Edaphochlamys debaryana TaxID=47281 RepID=A0A835XJ40_9CHLO|nr:hypothetical protein HYH03_018986 [Edaphochlamys debaryana]|eukprot:KAG2482060.1 hypothetical protein HYH03_018986 [Edaphochlamys debaryana]